METPLRILLVEDSESDAALVIRRLKKAGYAVMAERVETAGQMTATLENQVWDCVIADYKLPQFDAPAALAVLQAAGLDLPFIVVSGTIGEETAVALMKAGAHDYLMKDNLIRLAPAIKRELAEAKIRRERQQAEESLRRSEKLFKALIEHAPDGVVSVGIDGAYKYLSPSARRIFGYGADDASASSASESTHPDDLPAVLAALNSLIQNPAQVPTLQYRFKHRDGAWRWIESTFSNLLAEPGVEAIVINFHDITERKRAEAALRESEERFRQLFATSPDAIVLIDPHAANADWPIVDCNEAACQMNGYTREELIGQSIDILNTVPETREGRLAYLDRVRREGVIHVEAAHRHQDGHVFPIEVSTSLFTFEGRELVLGIDRDITERKQAEEAVRESEERFRALVENSADVIALLSGEGVILYESPAVKRVLGYQPAEMVGHNGFEFLHPDEYAATQELYEEIAQQPHMPFTSEVRYRRKDGTWAWIHATGTNLLAEPSVKAVVINYHDITERKLAEEALVESQRRLATLIGNLPGMAYRCQNDPDWTMEFVSEGCLTLTGYESHRLLNSQDIAYARLIHPDDRAMVWNTVQAGIQARQPYHMEYRIQTAGGQMKWVWEQGQAIFTDAGELSALEGLITDITERRLAEEGLRASERRERERAAELQTIMDVVPAAIWIAHDQMSQVVTGNQAAYELLRVPSGSNASLTAPGGQRPAHARIFQNGVELPPNDLPLQISAATGVEIWDFEEEIVFDDGTVIHVLGNAMPFFDETGRPRGAVGAFINITERKRAEEALRESDTFVKTVLDNLPIGVAVNSVEPSVNFTYMNDNFPKVYRTTREALARPDAFWSAIYEDPDFREELKKRVLDDLASGDAERMTWVDVPITRKGAATSFITAKNIPIPDRPLTISTVWDVTERKHLEEQLRGQVTTLRALAEIDREITATTESRSVLELVCRRAAELVRAPKAAIVTRTAASDMTMAASHGLHDAARVGAEFIHSQQAGLMRPGALKTREAFALNEITADTPFMPEMFIHEGVRALVIVPLVAGGEAADALIVLDTTTRQWQADELQVLTMLAGQAALALEKLRLLETARSRARHLETLNEIGQAITSSLDLDLVLTTLLEKVRQATESEACSVALIDQASGDMVFRQAVGGRAYAVIGLRLPPGQGLAGWVVQHRQSVLVTDVATDARAYRLRDQGDFITRDLIAVPLITLDVVTGVIELVNKRSGRFDEDDRRLLESVAAQAAIAIEHARLFETEHAGRESLETLYRVGQAVNSTLDADTILDLLTDEAMRATHATHGSALVAQPDRGCFERRSLRGYSPEQAAGARADWLPLDRGVNGRAYRTQQVIYVPDVHTDPDYHPLISETHSELAVPILRGGQVIGNLDLQSPDVDAFRDVRMDFLQALTDQVAIALENARLFEETHRHADEMSIVSQVALVGAAGRPFDETVARATDALILLWPEATLGFFFVDEAGQLLRPHRSYYGLPPERLAALRIPTSTGIIGWAVRERQPVRVGNVTVDPRYIIISPGTQSVMAAPLVAGDRVIGVVGVDSPRSDAFSGDDLRILTTLAGQLATIFEKARLDAELAGYVAQLEQRVQERTAEIRRDQARTQAILDALGEGVVVTDMQGAIQYMNRAMERTTGFSTQEVIGQEGRLWRSSQTPEGVYQAMWTAVLAGRTWYGEVVNRRKDGELYFAALTTAPILTTDGGTEELAGVVSIQRDITERKRAEEEMRRALEKERELNTLKSNFVSLTSHEFRTPLTTILSSAELVEHYGDRWTAEKKLVHLRRIQTAVQYMTSLLNDILIIGKAEAGKLEFMPAPLDLVKYCRDLVEELQLTDKGAHLLIFDSEVDCAPANMDDQLLRHILSNLLSNALKYSPQGGSIQFDLACQNGQAVFRIQDHGLGIPLEDQARLFETFHRASNARNIPGTGLGLAIVKRSVELHGGLIDVASQVGAGTTVTVTLPLGAVSGA